MAKTTSTVITAVCDRCKRQGDTSQDSGHGEWGELKVTYDGFIAGRTWQGDAGGVTHKGNAWLCLWCTRDFLAFLHPTAKEAEKA